MSLSVGTALVRERVQQLAKAILDATPVANDGGAAIQAAAKLMLTGTNGWAIGTLLPPSMAAAKVKATCSCHHSPAPSVTGRFMQ